MPKSIELQIALLRYMKSPKPIGHAAKLQTFSQWQRKEIITVKNALWHLGLIEDMPGRKTSARAYYTTNAGKKHLKELEKQGGKNADQ